MIEEKDIYAKSNSEIISVIGRRFKEYRIFSKLTQREVAERAGVSVFTISQFEKGEGKNITLGSLLSLLRSINFLEEIEKLLPEIPPTPEQIRMLSKKKERIRHEK